jgi:hypothetical protein
MFTYVEVAYIGEDSWYSHPSVSRAAELLTKLRLMRAASRVSALTPSIVSHGFAEAAYIHCRGRDR